MLSIIWLHRDKWFQVLLFNTKNSIQHYSFVCAVKWFQLLLCNTNKSTSVIFSHTVKWSNSSIRIIDKSLQPIHVRADLGVRVLKGYSTLPKASLIDPHYQMIYFISRTLVEIEGSYPSSETQSMYSTGPADWVHQVWGLACHANVGF